MKYLAAIKKIILDYAMFHEICFLIFIQQLYQFINN